MSELIKVLEERILVLRNAIPDFEKKGMGGACIANTAEIIGLEKAVSEIKKQQLKDRFFLEEAIFRNLKCWDEAEEYTETLLHDWLSEMVEDNPMSEQERKGYIQNVLGWDDDFAQSAYFSSEKQLKHYLRERVVLSDDEFAEED